MAKSKSFFGLRRGSTKSLTFQVLNGRQVTKDRVYDVKNPRTFSQMQQRMVMATAAAAYAGMREIVDHSFEGYTYGQPTMSEFIRLNAKMLRDGLTDGTCIYNPYKDRGALPNPYIVSKGTLNRKLIFNADRIDIDGSQITAYLGFEEIDLTGTTVRQFFEHIGLSLKGYITILCIAYSPESNIHQFGYIRITPNGQELDETLNSVSLIDICDVESNVPIATTAIDEVNMTISFDFDEGAILRVSMAAILSEKQVTWKRSSESMMVQTSNLYPVPSPAETLATYPVGTDYILNGGTV